MAGHSHWANISRHKGIQDNKRAKLWSKLARYIMIAARNGGGDPTMNLRLRYAIDKAKAVSMPKDNIERAVKKGTGDLQGESMEEITYEGYGPGGVAVMVETLTDKRTRTNGDVRLVFDKNGGSFGTPGCVSYLFERIGMVVLDARKYPDEEAVMTAAIIAEAKDCKKEGDYYEITTEVATFTTVADAIREAGYEPEEAEIKNLPTLTVDLDVETGKLVVKLLEALEDNDDVQTVYSNANITEEMVNA